MKVGKPTPCGMKREVSAKQLLLRGLFFGRRMRRNIWRKHFPGTTWKNYLKLEEEALRG